MNSFGAPITEETLKEMSAYRGKRITKKDLAREALKQINAENKNIEALGYVLKLKKDFGTGASTLCLIYNATGDRVELVERKDWDGSVYKAEPPRCFENGQWIAFLHTSPPVLPYGSVGARVFRGYNDFGVARDFMVAWSTPPDATQNSAYTEVRERDHFPRYWNYILGLVKKANKITKDESDQHFSSVVSIGGITSPEFIAVLKHKP